MTVEQLSLELKKLANGISTLIKGSEFDSCDDLSGLSNFDIKNLEQRFLLSEYRAVMMNLDAALHRINYLNRPVTYEGILHKNCNGRYGTRDGYEYTCGRSIEAYYYDIFNERYEWVWSSVEHDGTDYYVVGCKNTKLEGLKVRRRS